jgi:hypothetical protein
MAERPTEDELKLAYVEWFAASYGGVKPVITSSTGFPAVHFALHVLERYGQQAEEAGEQ